MPMPMQAGEDVAPGRERLEQAERRGAGVVRHAVGDERHGQAEHPADAEAGEEPVDAEITEARGEGAQPGAQRVDAGRRCSGCAPGRSGRRARRRSGRRRPSPRGRRRSCRSRIRRPGPCRRPVFHRAVAREVEELLVEAVEEPGQRGDVEDEPVFAGEGAPPGRAAARARRPVMAVNAHNFTGTPWAADA